MNLFAAKAITGFDTQSAAHIRETRFCAESSLIKPVTCFTAYKFIDHYFIRTTNCCESVQYVQYLIL